MPARLSLILVLVFVSLAASGCGSSRQPGADEYRNPETEGSMGAQGYAFGAGGLSLGLGGSSKTDTGSTGGALGVNAYLWRGALDTLSFMPLASADPFGGVIITDWFQPPAAQGERFKATAYILGRQLRADGIRIVVFRQVQQGSQWVDATVSPATTGEIENKVLARARELRAQSASN